MSNINQQASFSAANYRWENGLRKTFELESLRRERLSLSNQNKRNSIKTEIKNHQHLSPFTEFKKGEHKSFSTEFKKGQTPWNKDKPYLQIRGEKHPHWIGGKSRYRGVGWEYLRKQIWIRDNYTCQECGRKNCKLNAHHIVPYRITKDNSLNNLISLCVHCHAKKLKEEIKRYGK